MFSIDSVTIFNFKSYKGNHEIQFPTEPGLYFLTGKNNLEPALGSNGAGKSTLLDAVYWCLFGHTTRGLKASDIISWGENTTMVAVRLTVAQGKITVIRKQAPNSLSLNGHLSDRSAVDKAICLNAQSFLYSVILPQFGTPFFDMKPAEKLSLFSDIKGLDFWLEKSEQATEAASLISDNMLKLDNAMRDSEAWIKMGEANLEEYSAKKASFEEIRGRTVTVLQGKLDWVIAELGQLTNARSEIVDELTDCYRQKNKCVVACNGFQIAKDRNQDDRNTLNAERAAVTTTIASIEKIISKLLGMKVVCPHCQQKVDANHLRKEKQVQGSSLGKQRARLSEVDSDLREVDKVLDTLNKKISATGTDIKNFDSRSIELKIKLSNFDMRLNNADKRVGELKQEIKLKRAESNPFTEMLTKAKAEVTTHKVALLKQKNDLNELQAQYDSTIYWVAGFKRVRLFVIEETLRQLEIEVNNSLASLGLMDWSIEFDVERENKSGGVTKGFVVFIRCPSNPEPVRWESWSGGETQRLQLAGNFGLANLIMMQAGLANTIEFYDEPSNHLSDEGLNDLAETLAQRAIDDDKCIYIADHQVPEFGNFLGILTVIKDKNGTRFGHDNN